MIYANYAEFFKDSMMTVSSSAGVQTPYFTQFLQHLGSLPNDSSLAARINKFIEENQLFNDSSFQLAVKSSLLQFRRVKVKNAEDDLLPKRVMQIIRVQELKSNPDLFKAVLRLNQKFPFADRSIIFRQNDSSFNVPLKLLRANAGPELETLIPADATEVEIPSTVPITEAAISIFNNSLRGYELPRSTERGVQDAVRLANFIGFSELPREFAERTSNARIKRDINQTLSDIDIVEQTAEPADQPKKHRKFDVIRKAIRNGRIADLDAIDDPDKLRIVDICSKISSKANNITFSDCYPRGEDKQYSTLHVKNNLNIGLGKMGPKKISDWHFLLEKAEIEYLDLGRADFEFSDLIKILEGAPQLRFMDMRCQQITPSNMEEIKQINPSLKIIVRNTELFTMNS